MMKERRRGILLGLLLLSGLACANPMPGFSEDWTSGLDKGSELILAGERHVGLWTQLATESLETGFPGGIVGLAASENGFWVGEENGRLSHLVQGSIDNVWQPAPSLKAMAQGEAVWLCTEQDLLQVSLSGEHPLLAGTWPLPSEQLVELRATREVCFLRAANKLYPLGPDGPGRAIELPERVEDWAVQGGAVLLLLTDGHLRHLPLELTPNLPLAGKWRRLRQVMEGLWLQDQEDAWCFWPADKDFPEPGSVFQPKRNLLPLSSSLLVEAAGAERTIFRRNTDRWLPILTLEREEQVQARLFRSSARWRLLMDNRLQRRTTASWQTLSTEEQPLDLVHAGAGPLLLTEDGLLAYSEGGQLIGGWNGTNAREAFSWEDWLLLTEGPDLCVFWTGEESPWLEQRLAEPGASMLRASESYVALRSNAGLICYNRTQPWSLERLAEQPEPAGIQDMLVMEDFLLLLFSGDLLLRQASEDGWIPAEGSWLHRGGRWMCKRNADKVLLLDETGLLSQIGLTAGRPQRLDWEQYLPLAGSMSVFRDSLRITGSAGILDWPLPALEHPNALPEISPLPGVRVKLAGSGRLLEIHNAGEGTLRYSLYPSVQSQREQVLRSGDSQSISLPSANTPASSLLLHSADGSMHLIPLVQMD